MIPFPANDLAELRPQQFLHFPAKFLGDFRDSRLQVQQRGISRLRGRQ